MYMVYLWCHLLGFVQALVRQASWINSLSLRPLVVSKTYNSHDKVLRVRLVSADNCSWYSSVVLFLQVEQETSQELELIVHTCSSDWGPWAKKVRKGNNDTIGGATICWNSDCFWEEKGVQLQLDGWEGPDFSSKSCSQLFSWQPLVLNLCIIPSTKGGIPKPIPAHLFQTAEIREASSYNRPLRHHRISTSEGVASQIFELLFYSVYIYNREY